MSNLTKILIILLSLSSIFLCGAVITYVGTANNYKKQADTWKSRSRASEAASAQASKQLNEKTSEWQALKAQLEAENQRLRDEKNEIAVELRNAERQNLEYQGRVNSWAGVVSSFEQTIANMEQSRDLMQQQLEDTREDMIAERRKLNEITASLYEKIVQLKQLEADRRRFLEEKQQLEEQMTKIMDGTPQTQKTQPVTQKPGQAQPAMDSYSSPTGLSGVVHEISNQLVTISLGSADGVKQGMIFHATRGDDFLADIVITDVDTNKSAGVLELVQERPRIGDYVSTSL